MRLVAVAGGESSFFRYLYQETVVRSVTRKLHTVTLIMAGLLPLAMPLPAHTGDGGYRLLELDGYKVKWGDRQLGVGAIVSYAFVGQSLRVDDAYNCGDLAPIETLVGNNLSMETLVHETAAAFRVWERAAGLLFHQVDDVRDADIVLGAQGKPSGRAYANVSYAPGPHEGVRTIEQALVCLNPNHEWKVGFDGDPDVYDIRYTLIHEIGHAIGLDHPGPSGQVMAYRYTEDFDDLQPGDLYGVQLLYGRAADNGPATSLDTQQGQQPFEREQIGSLPISSSTGEAASLALSPPDGAAASVP